MLTLETQGRQETKLKKGDLIIIGIYLKKIDEGGHKTQTRHNIWIERKGEILFHNKKDTQAFMDELFNNVQFLPQMVKKIRAFKKLVSAFSRIELENGTVRNKLASKQRMWGYEFPLKVTKMR